MSDPKQGNLYHLILGLPDEVVSPNHYELLGLDHRVRDPATINKAAADQNRKLLHWQNSDRYAEVRALTFEVVHARDVLLNEATRIAYDQELGDWGLEEEGPWIEEEPAEPLSVRCPECSASFKLRNRELVGRRLPCPECGHRFTVRPEEEPVAELLEPVAIVLLDDADSDAELAALDNFEDMGEIASSPRAARRGDVFTVEPYREADESEEDERTSRSTARRPARRPKPRRAETRSRSRGWIIAGGVLVFIACVVLAGMLFFRSGPSSPIAEAQLAYLPADSAAVAYYRMGDVARSPFFQDHLTRSMPLRNQIDEFRGRTGMELTDLDTIVIGLKDNNLNRFSSLGRMQHVQGLKFVAVARATKEWDRSRLIGDHTESATHNDQTYHRFSPDADPTEAWALYLPDARTLIFGTEAEVKAAIDTNGQPPDWQNMEFLRPEYPVIAASVAPTASGRVRGPRPVGGNMPLAMNGVTFGSGLIFTPAEIRDVSFLRFETAAEADQFRRAVGGTDSERRRFGIMPRAAGSVKFTQHGRTVAIEQGNFHRLSEIRHGNLATVPFGLLARLGKGSGSSNLLNQNPAGPVVEEPRNPPTPGGRNLNPPQPSLPGEVLGPPPDAATLRSLIIALQDRREARNAARQLAKMQPDPVRRREVAGLLEVLIQHGGHFDKQAAAEALGVWGSGENVPFLLGVFQGQLGRDIFLDRPILVALGRLKDPRGLPTLIDTLKQIQYRTEAAKGLKHYGSAAEPELLKALADDDWQTQRAICEVLRDIGTARSLPTLDALAAGGSVHVKSPAQTAANAIRARGN